MVTNHLHTSWYVDMDGVTDYVPAGIAHQAWRDVISAIATARAMGSRVAHTETVVDGETEYFTATRQGDGLGAHYLVERTEKPKRRTKKQQEADQTLEHLSVSLKAHAKALLDQVDTLRIMADLIDRGQAPSRREVIDVLFPLNEQQAEIVTTRHSIVVFNNARTDA